MKVPLGGISVLLVCRGERIPGFTQLSVEEERAMIRASSQFVKGREITVTDLLEEAVTTAVLMTVEDWEGIEASLPGVREATAWPSGESGLHGRQASDCRPDAEPFQRAALAVYRRYVSHKPLCATHRDPAG